MTLTHDLQLYRYSLNEVQDRTKHFTTVDTTRVGEYTETDWDFNTTCKC
uniref:Uncharacterized protein n=1 Tax=Anguilla anguilla TaxID=7936 RepID=A0A0E9TU19_ANGAN